MSTHRILEEAGVSWNTFIPAGRLKRKEKLPVRLRLCEIYGQLSRWIKDSMSKKRWTSIANSYWLQRWRKSLSGSSTALQEL